MKLEWKKFKDYNSFDHGQSCGSEYVINDAFWGLADYTWSCGSLRSRVVPYGHEKIIEFCYVGHPLDEKLFSFDIIRNICAKYILVVYSVSDNNKADCFFFKNKNDAKNMIDYLEKRKQIYTFDIWPPKFKKGGRL